MSIRKHALVWCLMVVVLAAPAAAGTIGVAWNPVTDSDLVGYRVFYGTSAGTYTSQQDVGNTTSLTLSGLPDCSTYYVAVKARDAAGNISATYSTEISGMPRPTLAQIQPAGAEPGQAVTVTITGANFAPGATVQLGSAAITAGSVVVQSCTQLTATLTVGASATLGTTTVDVTNSDGVFGTASGLFSVLAPTPPTVVSALPANLTTAVPVSVNPTVTFSEAMKATTITAATVRLLDPTGAAVAQGAGSPSLSADGRVVTIAPAASLGHSRTYRVQVVGGTSGVRDVANTALTATYIQASGFTTVADAAGPSISALATSNLAPTAVTVTWTTNEPADSQVFYRKAGDTSYQQTALDTTLVTSHSVRIQGLSPATAYAFYVQSSDSVGNDSTSSPDGAFTTGASTFSYISIEAESGTLTAPVRATSGAGAFRGAWIDTPAATATGTAVAPSGRADLAFHVPVDGTWYVWVRLYGAATTSDAWYESVDGAGRQLVVPAGTGSWRWTAGRSYSLTQGLHNLELGGREAQARADRVVITNDATFVPTEQPGDDVTPPAAATGLAATASDRAIALAWTNAGADVASVVVRVRTDGRFPATPADGLPVVTRAVVAGAVETLAHAGLVNGTAYSYSVFMIDAAGNASVAAQVSTTPVDDAPPPGVGAAWRTDRR